MMSKRKDNHAEADGPEACGQGTPIHANTPVGTRQEIEQAMKEGYLATRDDRVELNEDWGAVEDIEGWPA